MTITLTNDFHNTSVTLRANVLSHIHHTATAYLTAGQVKRAKRTLCGVTGCACSDATGTRGRQELPSGKRLEINYDAAFSGASK